ncbi:LamG domain-containing protein [Kitasatospora sp. HPMI-4]|uniref:LamG domain-containing protein n=1 Tax=Kitasatospora sp. HPMI-4 TaxID=3448443 RepID=UPI003F1BC58E
MHRRVPPRPGRARRNLARALSLTALVTATSLTMSVAQAAPTAPSARPAADPAPASGPVNGELAHYDFQWSEQDYTPNLIDNGPRGVHHNGAHPNQATDNGTIWGITSGTRRHLVLDGTNQFMSVPVPLATNQSFSVAAWVQPKSIGRAETVISQDSSRVGGFALRLDASGKPQFGIPASDADQAGWDTVTGSAVLPLDGQTDSGWTHLEGVFDATAGEIRLYVNGTLAGRAPHTSAWHAGGDVEVGRSMAAGAPAEYFPGNIAEVRVWQRAQSDLEASNTAIPDGTVREDRCTVGSWLHAGGPKVKALTAQALNGTPADVRRTANTVWGYGPLSIARREDQSDARTVDNAQNARPAAWAAVTKPFGDGTFGDDYNAFLNVPNYFDPMQKFLLDTGEKNFDGPGPTTPSQAALNQALTIAHQHQATEQSSWATYHWYAGDDVVKKWSAYEVARFIRFGGFPTQAPAKDSLEFRTEVEDLKTQWAACDGGDPQDPNHVLDDVVATASAEWQAEQASMAKQRADIVAADTQANQDVRTAAAAMNEAQGQAYIVGRMLFFQKYWQGQPKSNIFYPKPDRFAQATAAMATAKKAIQAQLTIAQKAAASAKAQADKANAAQADAGKTALANGTPYGRGLTYALQSAQVTSASAAAAQAAAKAIETTLNTVSAGQADSRALYALIDTQNHAAQAEFQRAAAQAAADQAHNAAAAAAAQADQAAQNAARAKADRITAEQAEATAKAAAADADAKRKIADQERANAAADRSQADAKRAEAQAAEARAKEQQAAAATAMGTAQTAEQTAADKENAAKTAEAQAYLARDAAVAAENQRDSLQARQKALEAAAAAAQGTSDAQESRQAANDAKTAAGQATDAAGSARAAANQAGQDAVGARAAATQAAGAAKRARAAADAAQADAATTSAAAATAHAATADAIAASAQAAQNVKNADQQAHVAAANAVKARQDALASRIAADHAAADSARTAGQAYAAAQYAAAARDAASGAIAAGNTAVSLGTPYRETDISAGLAVLVGEDSKTIAQQQADVAKARSDEAAKAAKDAQALADKANADAKAAAQLAANAAADAAKAAASVQRARDWAAQAAAEAAAAKTAEAATTEYDRQANADALASTMAARDAQSDADAANASATDAEKDAAAAHQAATSAENDAATARGAASNADQDATAAEQAAANAQTSAAQADQAAAAAEAQDRKDQADAAAANASSAGQDPGPDLGGDDEKLLLAQCGQTCVDEFRRDRAEAGKSVLDWVVENGGQILLDVLGVTDAKKCFTDPDVESCLWTALNIASLVAVAGKLPAVSKAVIRISEGIGKFIEESEMAKRALDRLREIITEARQAANEACDLAPVPAVAGRANLRAVPGVAAAHPMLAAPRASKKFCGIKWVSPKDPDWVSKGAHINLKNGREVRIFPSADGGIGGAGILTEAGLPTQAEINATVDAVRSDAKLRSRFITIATEVMEQMNIPPGQPGSWGAEKNRAVEMKFLIDALKRMG